MSPEPANPITRPVRLGIGIGMAGTGIAIQITDAFFGSAQAEPSVRAVVVVAVLVGLVLVVLGGGLRKPRDPGAAPNRDQSAASQAEDSEVTR